MGRRRRHREPLTPAEQDLVLAHQRLARIVAYRMKRTLPAAVDVADMISTGIIGLVKAVQDFKPAFGILFTSYASIRIRGEILDHFRALDVVSRGDRARGGPGAFQTLHLEDLALAMGTDVPVADILPDPRAFEPLEILARRPDWSWPSALVDGLPSRERRVLELYYRDGLLLREIGVQWGVTESRINQLKQRGLARLREDLMSGNMAGVKCTVVGCVERVLREGGCLTSGEILSYMNRASMRPSRRYIGHGTTGRMEWDTLEHRERLFEVKAAADSHPELFTNHGLGVGYTLRDDAGDASDDDAGEVAPARKEEKVPGAEAKMCVHCSEREVAKGESSGAKAARGLGLCSTCYSDNDVRHARREKVGYPNSPNRKEVSVARGPKHGTCGHCAKRDVSNGASSDCRAARRLSLCLTCYKDKDVKRRRREKIGYPMGQSRSGVTGKGDQKLLTGPAPTSRKKSGGLTPARRRRTSPPAPVGDPDLRADLGRVLRTSFARFAAGTLRTIADDLEASAEETAS